MDPEKLQAVLSDESLLEACDLNRSLEKLAILEAQLKEMNPNLDSISEYESCIEVIGPLNIFLLTIFKINHSHQV